jgi:hypothetical protein
MDDAGILLDQCAGQIAGRGELQPTGLGCSSKQEQAVGRDRRSGDFRVGEVGVQAIGWLLAEGS